MIPRKSSLEKTKDLCKWYSDHAGPPSMGSPKASDEYLAARWLSKRRSAVRKGFKISGKEKEILLRFGMEGLYYATSKKSSSLANACTYFEWVLKNGRSPKANGSPLETKLYRWMARKREGSSNVYPEDLQILKVPNAFEGGVRESSSNYLAIKLSLWYKEYGVPPKLASTDKTEKTLANWLMNKKQAYNGKGCSRVYPSDIEMLRSFGALFLLDPAL